MRTILLKCILLCLLVLNIAQAEQASDSNFLPPMTTLPQEELKPLLEKWDRAIESDRLQEKDKAMMMVVNYVSEENMRFRGSYVLRYDNPEIKDRIVDLYLKECAKANQPSSDVSSNTNPWLTEEPVYIINLMNMAESTFDPRIYEIELNSNISMWGDLRFLYLATVRPEETLEYLFESKCGYRAGTQKGHQDYFYHGETAWGMSVDNAYTLLSLMSTQSPDALINNRDRVLTFLRTHLKPYAASRQVPYKPEPIYFEWQDYDVRNGAIDVLRLLGESEDTATLEEIIHGAPELDPKQLKGGPQGRYEQIQQKGLRVIEEIRQKTANAR